MHIYAILWRKNREKKFLHWVTTTVLGLARGGRGVCLFICHLARYSFSNGQLYVLAEKCPLEAVYVRNLGNIYAVFVLVIEKWCIFVLQ